MNTFLWVAQVVLAFAFLAHGLLFLFPPEAVSKVSKQMPFPVGFLRFICIAEILGAFGLTLPGLTGLLPWLTPLAATGLVIIMSGAVITSLMSGAAETLIPLVLGLLAAVVAYGRWRVRPLPEPARSSVLRPAD